jgi:DNA ligase-1
MSITLYKTSIANGKLLTWTIEWLENSYRTISGYSDGAKTTSKWTVVYGKNTGKANATTDVEQMCKEAEAIVQKKISTGYSLDKYEECVLFKPMLADTWNPQKATFPIFSQPKLDGIRCIANKCGLWSRNGKPILSVPHLSDIFVKHPNLILDGELYCDKFHNDFNKICSIVKKTKPTKSDFKTAEIIEYHIYDCPSNKNFSKRMEQLEQLELEEPCVIVETKLLFDLDSVNDQFDEYINDGYEGQILRKDLPYENKRSKTLLKHKSFMDREYIIKDVIEGKGNKTGMIGSMVFESEYGKPFSANVKIGWDESRKMWKNRRNLIGKTATIKFANYTPDHIPRFPYVIKFAREDYE